MSSFWRTGSNSRPLIGGVQRGLIVQHWVAPPCNSGYNMEKQFTPVSRIATGIDRARRDLTRIAVASAAVGTLTFCGGLVTITLSDGQYPVAIATIAGVFMGIAIDLGVVLGIFGVATELARNS
jgi:hypothetical protein